MKLDEKLIKQLADGEIAMRFCRKDMELAKKIASSAKMDLMPMDFIYAQTLFMYRALSSKLVMSASAYDLPIVGISNFEITSAKFHIGQKVTSKPTAVVPNFVGNISQIEYANSPKGKQCLYTLKNRNATIDKFIEVDLQAVIEPGTWVRTGKELYYRCRAASDQIVFVIENCDEDAHGLSKTDVYDCDLNIDGVHWRVRGEVVPLDKQPKFRIGQVVFTKKGGSVFVIKEIRAIEPDGVVNFIYYFDTKSGILEDDLTGKKPDLQPSADFKVGEEYEFTYGQMNQGTGWTKGKLLAIVDSHYKYIVKRDGIEQPCSYDMARHIKREPTPIVRWINIFPDGSIGANVFESAIQAIYASSVPNTKAIPLTGEIPAEE